MELLQKHERQYILSKGQRRKVIDDHRPFGNWIVHSKPSRRAVGVENKNLHKYNSDRLVEPDALHDVTNGGVTGQWTF